MTRAQSKPRLGPLPALVLGTAVGFAIWLAFAGHFTTRVSPQTELEQALEESDFLPRIARVAAVFEHASPDVLDDLRRIIEAYPAAPQDSERILFLEWWARFDPEAALTWARADDLRHGQALVQHVLRVWARTDPVAALERARRPSSLRAAGTAAAASGLDWLNESELAVMAGWEESLVPGLEEWVFDQDDVVKQQTLIQVMVRNRVAMHGAEPVWEWAQSLPEPHGRITLLAAASVIAARDPQEAVRLTQSIVDAGDVPGVSVRVSVRWCEREPEAALEWLVETPDSKARNEAILECARSWISNSRADFLAFVEAQPDPFPEWLAPAVRLYARALEDGDEYVRGLAIADRIGNTRLGNQTTALILRRWLERDQAAASAWIEQHQPVVGGEGL